MITGVALPSRPPVQIQNGEKHFTFEEYLEKEETSLVNHEFDNGKLIPMAGGTPPHSKIKGLVVTALNNSLRASGKFWDVYNSDIRIWLPEIQKGVMPDAAVVAGEPVFKATKPVGALLNPTLVVEVLSKETEAYDRNEKFKKYQTLPSFEEYLLIAQGRPYVETFVKRKGIFVKNEVAEGLKASVTLTSLGVSLALADIYWGVIFSE